jgi:hypothetical protein
MMPASDFVVVEHALVLDECFVAVLCALLLPSRWRRIDGKRWRRLGIRAVPVQGAIKRRSDTSVLIILLVV